jgi:apolipoprotein N-acyltransferase
MPGVLLALASAGLYALCFPPLSLRALAPLALAPLFVAAARSRLGVALALGLLWGAVATLGVTSWMPRMLGEFFGVSRPAGIAALVALGVCGIGPAYAAFAGWLAWSAQRRPPAPWTVAAAWLGAEWLRSHGPLGSPWALAGYAAVGTPFAQAADLAGPAGPGFLVALGGAALASLAARELRPPRFRLHLAGVAALLLAAWLYGALRLAQPFGEGEPLPVAMVQSGVTWGYRFDPARSEPNLQRTLALHREALARAPALVVWPEHAIDFYLRDPGPEHAALRAGLDGAGADLVLGAPHYTRPGGAARYFNSVFLLSRGEVVARSDKTRLVPFAERSPFGALWPGAGGNYVAGEAPRVLRGAAAAVGAFLCAEAMFPDVARRLASDGAELLVNPSNDFWFASAPAARLQLETATLRAVETRRWLLRATPTGYSALVDPHGRIVRLSEYGGAEVLHGELRRSRAATPYQRLVDAPQHLAFAGVALASLTRLRTGDATRGASA